MPLALAAYLSIACLTELEVVFGSDAEALGPVGCESCARGADGVEPEGATVRRASALGAVGIPPLRGRSPGVGVPVGVGLEDGAAGGS